MKKLIPSAIAAVVVMSGSQALGQIWNDDFESYANTAGLSPTYTQLYSTYPMLLDTGKGFNSSQSIHFGATAANSQARAYFNLPGGSYTPTDANPLKLEFMVDTDVSIWSTRQYIELRSYSGGVYNSGTLNQLFALGFTSTGVNTARVNRRILNGPNAGWGDLTDTFATRATIADPENEWTKLGMWIKGSTIEFYINDNLDTTLGITPGLAYDSVVIGSGLSSAGADVWVDDLVVVVPEPSSLAFALLGGFGLFVARMRRQ